MVGGVVGCEIGSVVGRSEGEGVVKQELDPVDENTCGPQAVQVAEEVEPVEGEYMPALQLMQAVAPKLAWYWPAGQVAQAVAPVPAE